MALDRIGQGPFDVIEILDPEYVRFAGDPPLPETEGPPDRCACCGSRIAWRVILQDRSVAAPGRFLLVGRTCASRAAAGLDANRLKKLLKAAEQRRDLRWQHQEEFCRWLRSQPHGRFGWPRSRFDELLYWSQNARDPKRLVAAVQTARLDFEAARHATLNLRQQLEQRLEQRAEELAQQPHPFIQGRGLSLADYLGWILANRQDEQSYRRALNCSEPAQRAA